jgi:hypothetical protein
MGILGPLARRFASAAFSALLLAQVSPVRAQETLERDVKAAYLFNFTKFVDWPRPTGTNEPFRVCVSGDDALRESVEKTIAGEQVEGRPLLSLAPRTPSEARNCQVLFIGGDGERETQLLSAVRDLPVLTVSDTLNFARRGGGIEFVREKNRLRFDVNLQGAEQGGIRVSARLLRVARAVHESPKKK